MLRGASGTGPAAAWAVRAGEAGAGTSHPSRRGPTGGRRLDSRRRRQVGAGKGQEGQEFNVGCGGSGSDPGLRWSRLAEDGRLAPARRSTALPGLDYAQCASVGGTSTRRPHASSQGRSPSSSSRPGCGPGWRQLGTRHRTPVTLLLGPVLPDSHINLISESRVWPGGGRGGQLETRHRTPVRLRLGPA